jgi:hypothetical protein
MTREEFRKLLLKTLQETEELQQISVTFSPDSAVFTIPMVVGGGALDAEYKRLEIPLDSWYIPMNADDDFSYLGPMLMMLVRHRSGLPVSQWNKDVVLVVHNEAETWPVSWSKHTHRLALYAGVGVRPPTGATP